MRPPHWVLLSLILACEGGNAHTGSIIQADPTVNVAGIWRFTGQIAYSKDTTCLDTLTVVLTQVGTRLESRSTDWHFRCTYFRLGNTPDLAGVGQVSGDMIQLQWNATTPWLSWCRRCSGTFAMSGQLVDAVLAGPYHDSLGGVGTWRMRR